MERRGIDVSYYQGEIDFEKLKDKVDFVIIRCGYGKDIESQDDKYYFRNVNECIRLNIPFGVYLYSYAKSTSDAVSEANHVLRLVKNYKIPYPIFYDVEDKSQSALSNEELTDICTTFCNILENNGYYVGIYANLYWFNTKLNSDRLNKYDKWLAEWSKSPSYNKPFGMWQYTSEGRVEGINGRVDMDIAYKDYPEIIKSNNLNNYKDNSNGGNNDNYVNYTVVKGDSLWKIGKKYNVKWQDIARLNNIKIPYIIRPGQILKIPVDNSNSSNFKVGDKVVFKGKREIYTSTNSTTPIKAKYNGGTITKIFPGTLNELQLNTNRGYVRISDVRKV